MKNWWKIMWIIYGICIQKESMMKKYGKTDWLIF